MFCKLRNKSFLYILILIITIQTFTYSNAQMLLPVEQLSSPIDILTPSAILIDSKTGNILFEKNSNEKMYPASITKIMTAILALEKGNLNSKVILSKQAVTDIEPNSSNAGLMIDEELTMEQLLYAMLLWSANESANAIAEAVGGSKEEFAKMMTTRAKELGALNTNFINPNGLHNPDHYTTAYDMAMIAKHAMTIPKFRDIVRTTHYILSPTNKMPKEKELFNRNQLLLQTSRYYYSYAIGIKTGYTTDAGSTLVSSASKDGAELIAVVLNSPIEVGKSYMYLDSIKMLEYGFENFESYKIVSKNQLIDTIKVKGSRTRVNAIVQDDCNVLVPKGTDRNTVSMVKHIDTLHAPVKKGDMIGYVSYIKDNKLVGKVNVIADNNADKSTFSFFEIPKGKTILSILWFVVKIIIFLIVILTVSFILLIIIYNKYRLHLRNKKKKVKSKALHK